MRVFIVQGDCAKCLLRRLLSYPEEYIDSVHGYEEDVFALKKSKKTVGNLNIAAWKDYRASLTERFIAANERDRKMPPVEPDPLPKNLPPAVKKALTVKTWNHILYGEKKGNRPLEENERNNDEKEIARQYKGGHKAGYSWISQCTPFPEEWAADDIIEAINLTLTLGKPDKDGVLTHNVKGHYVKVPIRESGEIKTAHIVSRDR